MAGQCTVQVQYMPSIDRTVQDHHWVLLHKDFVDSEKTSLQFIEGSGIASITRAEASTMSAAAAELTRLYQNHPVSLQA